MNTRRTVTLAFLLAAISAVAVIAQMSAPLAPRMPAGFEPGPASPFVLTGEASPHAAILGGDLVPDLVVSPGPGFVVTKVIDGLTLQELGSGFPFGAGYGAGVFTAMGELSGDAVDDIAVGMGPGGGLVQLFNGDTIAVIGAGYPFGSGFGGGVTLAVGDFNGDGRADIVTGQARGGGTVRVFSGTDYSMLLSQAPFGPSWSGGVNVATGDVDGDGRVELIVGQASGGSTVAVISAATHTVLASGAPYGPLSGGVFVAAADVNNDGHADVITAPGSGNSPVLVYDIQTLAPLASFAPYGSTSPGGVRVASTDLTGDGRADIITVPGPGRAAELKIFSGANFALLSTQLVYSAYAGGVFVSAAPAKPGAPANPGPPGAPTDLDFTVLGGNVELRWNAPTTGGEPTSYRVDVGSDRGLTNLLSVNVGNVTRFVATAPEGVFFVRIVAINAWGESPPSNEVVVVPTPTLGTGDLTATLSWDTQTDIDLHVIEPSGYHIFFRLDRRRGPTALLDRDNTIAYGPENIYTDRPVANGTYEIFVVPYGRDEWPTTARVTVRTNVGRPNEDYRVFTRTFLGRNITTGQNVATVTFPGGVITEVTGERHVVYEPQTLTTTGGLAASKP